MKRRSITRVRRSPGGRDRFGDPIASTATETELDGWLIAPREEAQPTERGRNGVVVGLTAFGPVGADLVHTDQVKIDGVLYDVTGEPGTWDGHDVGGVQVALDRAEG